MLISSGFLMSFTTLLYVKHVNGRPSVLLLILKRLIRFLPSVVLLLFTVQLLPLWSNAGPLWKSGIHKVLEPCRKHFLSALLFTSNLNEYENTVR